MNKAELISALATRTGSSKTAATAIVDALFNTDDGIILQAVLSDDGLKLAGFGSFEATDRAARVSRNPKTGEAVNVAARRVPRFKVGRAFKKALL